MAREPRGRVRNTDSSGSWGKRGGREGLAKAREEREKAKARQTYAPRRFRLDNNQEREIVILDESIDDFWFMYEHGNYAPNDKSAPWNVPCCKEIEECPVCEEVAQNRNSTYQNAAYTMFLTVLELHPDDPWQDKDGNDHFYSKRLMAVKATQSAELERLFEAAHNRQGTLRGTVVLMARDGGGQSAAIGKPVIMPSGEAFEFMDEDILAEDYGHDAIVVDGKTVKAADADITVFDYAKMFPKPSAKAIGDLTGLGYTPGSQADIEDTLNDEGGEQERPRSRRRSSTSDEDAPARGRARSRSRPSGEDQEQDQDQGSEDGTGQQEEERQTRRSTGRSRGRRTTASSDDAPRTRTRSRPSASVDDELPM